MKPKLRFPEFIYDWRIEPFSKNIKLLRGSSPRPIVKYRTTSSDGVNWIKIGDTDVGSNVIANVSERITKEGAKKSRAVFKGDIILANSMSFGKSYLLELDGFIYDGWFVLRDFQKNYHKGFLLQLLNSALTQQQYQRLSAGGVVQNISSDIVYSILLPKPEITEQEKIASFLSVIDRKVYLLTKKKEALEAYKLGLMQKIFSQELRFKREDGTDYPEWKEIVFKEFLKQRSERNKNDKGYEVYSVNNRLGFISQSVQFDGYVVASEDVSNYKLVYPGDIVYNPSRINVGSIAINSTNAIRIVSPLYNVFHVSSYPVTFWYRLQELHIFKHLVKVSCSGSVRDSLSFDDLSNFKMALPSIEEAVLIDNLLQKVEHNLSLLEELIKSTLALKTGLLQKMFV